LSQARDAIRKAGKPLHITQILVAIGRANTKQTRLALSGSLATYVRRDEIFTRPEPNTFGLLEFDHDPTSSHVVDAVESYIQLDEESRKVKAV